MLIGNKFERQEGDMPGKNSRQLSKAKDNSSVTILVPTLFEMSKTIMKMRCNLYKTGADDKMLDEFSKLESALAKMTIDIEYLRRNNY